jgi:hypothetical protein
MRTIEMKKVFLLLAIGFLLLLNTQEAYAATFNFNRNFWQKEDATVMPIGTYNDVVMYTDYDENLEGMVYLKFDIHELQGQGTVSTAILRLYGWSNTSQVGAYHVDDDSWTTSSINWANKPAVGPLMATQDQAPLSTTDQHQYVTFDLSKYNFTNDINDGFLSIALDEILKDVHSQSSFKSMEYWVDDKLPNLYIVTTTPVPEPSSMVLGLMGLGSVLGLRRKKA